MIISFVTFSQTGTWDWVSTSSISTPPSGIRQVYDISTDLQNNVFAVGKFCKTMTLGSTSITSESLTYYDFSSFVSKYNTSGQLQWLKKVVINSAEHGILAQISATDSNGNIYIGGNGGYTSGFGAFLAKYDANGNLMWSKTNFLYFEIEAINVSSDGNIIAMESDASHKNIYKLNSNDGSIIWQSSVTGAGSNGGSVYKDFVDSLGNIYATVFTVTSGTVNIGGQAISVTASYTSPVSFVYSVDAFGNLRWYQKLDNLQIQLGYTTSKDGNSYIDFSGGSGSTFQGITITSTTNRHLVLNNAGTLIQNSTTSPYFGKYRMMSDYCYAIYKISPFSLGGNITIGGQTFPRPTDTKKATGLILKFDKSNDHLIAYDFFDFNESTANIIGTAYCFDISPSGKFLVGGYYYSNIIFDGNTYHATPFDTANSLYSQDLFLAQNTGVASSTATLNVDNSNAKQSIKIYPNPFFDNLNISTQKNGIVQFFDTSGKFIGKENLSKGNNSFNKSSLPKGIYIYQIKNTNGEIISSGKIIKK